MPELPEVEVSRMGISPHMVGQTIKAFVFAHPNCAGISRKSLSFGRAGYS